MPYEFRSLFTPIRVGSLTLKNRIYSSGHAEAMAEGGRPTERLAQYHEAKARGGCALTIFGGSSSVHPSSDRKSTRLNSSHVAISYAVFCLKKKNKNTNFCLLQSIHTYHNMINHKQKLYH